jgi:hypothetical protein
VRAATRVNAEQASHGEARVKGRVQSRMSRTPAGVAVSKVRARLHNLVVSAPDQPHIRSPFATAAPTSRLRRAGLRKTRTFLENGVSRPRPASVRPPRSVRTDYVLRITVLGDVEDGPIVRQAQSWRLRSRLRRSHISRARPAAFAPAPRSSFCADDRRYVRSGPGTRG